MHLSDLLLDKGVTVFNEHMSVTGADGRLIAAPAEVTRRMLSLLARREGNDEQSGEGLHFGRATVLPLITNALVGPDPDGEAWLAAIAEGSFDLSISKRYGKVSEAGPPGTYLPRLVQRWDAERTKHNTSPNQLRRYRTGLSILIASVLLRELKNATNARAALGASWPVMRAISHRQYAELRRDLAQFGADGPFMSHLAEAVASAVQDWKRVHAPQVRLTNKAVDRNVPPGVDVADHFARQASAYQRREDTLVAFGRAMLGSEPPADDAARRAMVRLDAVPAYADVQRLVRQDVSLVTGYLDEPFPDRSSLAQHHKRLQQLMPICAGPSTVRQIIGRATLVVRFSNQTFDADTIEMTGSMIADTAAAETAKRIMIYAKTVGPPPPGVPLDHLAWFEVSACSLTFTNDWPARELWLEAGLMPAPASSTAATKLFDALYEWSCNSTVS